MSCSRGKASPDEHTKLRLFADSGGYCQNPNCANKLFVDTGKKNIHFAEMAHVFSASDRGPRANKEMKEEERGAYENLILLCANCHTTVDKAEADFPDSVILEWKRRHTEKISQLFGAVKCNSREEARALIEPVLLENRTIFVNYGPIRDERFNPESELPELWRRKVKAIILPNNRKLLAILDANRELLDHSERETLEMFRQHVDDLEARHLGDGHHAMMFPEGMNAILGLENE